MTRSVLALALSFAVALALYPALIGLLARRRAGQRVSGYGPATHLVKEGTPTMGGLLFCALPAAGWLLFDRSRAGFVVVFALLAGALVGLLDDVDNVRGRGALGLRAREKLLLQMVIGVLVGIGLVASSLTVQAVPVLGAVDLGWGTLPLAVLAVVAASNAVNLTDGVDGLAALCSVLALAAVWAVAVRDGDHSAAILTAVLCGGVLAFIVYNWFPARVFMGDTGALALGCALAALAAELRLLILLPLLGLVFTAETLSVIVNVTAIRRFGRRVLRASPLHHHFEEIGLRERRLVLCFGVAGAAAAALTVLIGLGSGAAR